MAMSLPIASHSYYLTKPFHFEKKKEIIKQIPVGFTLLKTLKTAICASDLHYYHGHKSKQKLRERLPLILLHEGVCLDLRTGMKVVPVAGNIIESTIEYQGRENLDPKLKYMGSTAPGLAREYFVYPQTMIIPLSPKIDEGAATLIEPLSVALKATSDMNVEFHHRVAIVGDGGLAYLLALIINRYKRIPKKNLTIYGVNEIKLGRFRRFGTIKNTQNDFRKERADIVFEVVGGINIQQTLDLIFELVKPGAMVGVLGISDIKPGIQADKLVNFGITIKGLTRSTYLEYEKIAELLEDQQIQKQLIDLIYPKDFVIKKATDLKRGFEVASNLKKHGRVILSWDVI